MYLKAEMKIVNFEMLIIEEYGSTADDPPEDVPNLEYRTYYRHLKDLQIEMTDILKDHGASLSIEHARHVVRRYVDQRTEEAELRYTLRDDTRHRHCAAAHVYDDAPPMDAVSMRNLMDLEP